MGSTFDESSASTGPDRLTVKALPLFSSVSSASTAVAVHRSEAARAVTLIEVDEPTLAPLPKDAVKASAPSVVLLPETDRVADSNSDESLSRSNIVVNVPKAAATSP